MDEAPDNRKGLPDDPELRKETIGQKMQDNRGVDRTDLVRTCARACIGLDDFDFLFEDLFGHYDDAGIRHIFLRELEPFMLEGEIKDHAAGRSLACS
ncbi:hypothetical protein GGF50DRAFT_116052 [Schizophyllum commune]